MSDAEKTKPDLQQVDEFTATWQSRPGWKGWFTAVNNQPLGQRFMISAFIFFLIGGLLAVLMRIQLALPENDFLGPKAYNQLFTMHGSIMMFLFAVPFLEGLALYLLPLMIGSRDVAFPRVTAFSFWTYLFGALFFFGSFFVGMVPEGGWFAYPPLTGPEFSKGEPYRDLSMDFWLLGLSLVEVAGITAGIEIVVTILKFRAPGMSLNRMPLFVWSMLVAGIMIIVAFTTLLAATILLELDRSAGTRFFDTSRGGSSLLWQHLFWFFGHPEVYIIFLPATGIVSTIVATCARRRLVAYPLVVMAMIVTGFVSFGLWVHHMFATGLPELSMAFFTAASLMIGVASGTQVFAWIATLWGSRPVLSVPLLYVLGFLFLFVLGGFTGVMIAVMPFDWQVHDTYFIVAHFHYVLIGGVLFPVLGGIHYWFPKITGRMLSEKLGKWSFYLAFIGFNATFFPMHIMGFFGMTRRVYTYPANLGLGIYNLIATIGAFILGAGILAFLINIFWSMRKGAAAPANPWNAGTLEWSMESPPPIYSFLTPPIALSQYPEWKSGQPSEHDAAAMRASDALAAEPRDLRATLVTDALNAEPQAVQFLPGPTLRPFLAAVGLLVMSLGVLTQYYILAGIAGIFLIGAIIRWLWPNEKLLKRIRESGIGAKADLPVFPTGSLATGWWAAVSTLVVMATLYGVAFFAYFYIRLFSDQWPQNGLPMPQLGMSSAAYGFLLLSAAPMVVAFRSFMADAPRRAHLSLLAVHFGGGLFLVLQIADLLRLPFAPQFNAYASAFYTVIGLQLAATAVGLMLTIGAHLRFRRKSTDRGSMALQMQITGLFWCFVAAMGVITYSVAYLSPRLI